MRCINFAKGMLYAYCRIPELLNEIDRCVDTYAINSSNINYNVMYSAYDYTERIISCTERKKKLIILYEKIEKAFFCCDEKNRFLLQQKYFEGKKVAELNDHFKVSIRTIYRRIKTALNQYAKRLLAEGIAERNYINSLRSEIWLINAMYRIEKSTRGKKSAQSAESKK